MHPNVRLLAGLLVGWLVRLLISPSSVCLNFLKEPWFVEVPGHIDVQGIEAGCLMVIYTLIN